MNHTLFLGFRLAGASFALGLASASAQIVEFRATINAAQETTTSTSPATGSAVMLYDVGTNRFDLTVTVEDFANTLTNSHYHEGAPGTSGGVVHGLGGASVYTQTGTSYGAVFADQTYSGDRIKLLTGLAYLNLHSNVYPAGEIRGQVTTSSRMETTRLINVSSRGWVGTGEQVLITGFVIIGSEPIRVLVTAKGPSLVPAGVQDTLANPMLSLHDSTSRQIVANDDFATTFASAEATATGFAPGDAGEAALLVVLPPGPYTAIVSGAGGATGVALNEAYEVQP